MYTLLFDHHLIKIFDQSNVRAEVYMNWGPEGQQSGKGQDNDRTNLLEAILVVMGKGTMQTSTVPKPNWHGNS